MTQHSAACNTGMEIEIEIETEVDINIELEIEIEIEKEMDIDMYLCAYTWGGSILLASTVITEIPKRTRPG